MGLVATILAMSNPPPGMIWEAIRQKIQQQTLLSACYYVLLSPLKKSLFLVWIIYVNYISVYCPFNLSFFWRESHGNMKPSLHAKKYSWPFQIVGVKGCRSPLIWRNHAKCFGVLDKQSEVKHKDMRNARYNDHCEITARSLQVIIRGCCKHSWHLPTQHCTYILCISNLIYGFC